MTEVKTLVVMDEAGQNVLTKLLAARGVNVLSACDCAQARDMLLRDPGIQVVIAALSLPDGNWWCLQRALLELDHDAEVIVCVPEENQCTCQILGHGAFAVITPPFKARELLPLIAAAASHAAGAGKDVPTRLSRMVG